MAEWTPDPGRHRPEGMEMAGRVEGVQPRLPQLDADIEEIRRALVWGASWVEEYGDGTDAPILPARAALDRIEQRLRRA